MTVDESLLAIRVAAVEAVSNIAILRTYLNDRIHPPAKDVVRLVRRRFRGQ
jgi:hypothetical protein